MPLPQPTPDLVSLDLLSTVAELGSIRQAALAHGISQPAASMRLRSLEAVLGVVLLQRSSGGAVLTPAGRAVVEWSEQILLDVRALLAGTSALRTAGRTHVHVAASMTVAEYLAPEWLVRLAELDPELHVSLEMANSEQVIELIRGGRADLGFVEGTSALAGLRSQALLEDELVLVVAPGHPLSRRRSAITAAQLAATPLVMREKGSGTREVLETWLGDYGYAVDTAVELGSTTAIKHAVESGVAPTVLSRLAVSSELRDGRLVVVEVRDADLSRTIRAVWSTTAPLTPAAKRVLARINDVIAGHAPSPRS